jgi:hypothetical protein
MTKVDAQAELGPFTSVLQELRSRLRRCALLFQRVDAKAC